MVEDGVVYLTQQLADNPVMDYYREHPDEAWTATVTGAFLAGVTLRKAVHFIYRADDGDYTPVSSGEIMEQTDPELLVDDWDDVDHELEADDHRYK